MRNWDLKISPKNILNDGELSTQDISDFSSNDIVKEVRETVLHEVAHHFGIDDRRLDELGNKE